MTFDFQALAALHQAEMRRQAQDRRLEREAREARAALPHFRTVIPFWRGSVQRKVPSDRAA